MRRLVLLLFSLRSSRVLGLDSFYPSCFIPRLYTQTLRWPILNIYLLFTHVEVLLQSSVYRIAVMCHAMVDHESTHVSVCFSGGMNPLSDVGRLGDAQHLSQSQSLLESTLLSCAWSQVSIAAWSLTIPVQAADQQYRLDHDRRMVQKRH